MNWNTKQVSFDCSLEAQVSKVLEEATEVDEALFLGEGIERIAEEAWDTLTAVEKLLIMLESRGVDLEEIKAYGESKNSKRGYYE